MDWARARRYALAAWRRFRRWPTRWQVAGWIALLLLVVSIGGGFDDEAADSGSTVAQPSLSVEDAAADAEQKAADRRAAAKAERRQLAQARRQRRARAARRRERERREAAALAAEQAPPPAPVPEPEPASGSGCDSNYSGCVPVASDVDCGGGSGDGPAYLDGTVTVIGSDVYDLDSDSDGTACE